MTRYYAQHLLLLPLSIIRHTEVFRSDKNIALLNDRIYNNNNIILFLNTTIYTYLFNARKIIVHTYPILPKHISEKLLCKCIREHIIYGDGF